MAKKLLRVLLYAFLAAVVCVLASALVLLFPVVQDDVRLDRIVAAVALDWRDFGKDKAMNRLQYEIDSQSIDYISDEDCSLSEEDDSKRVHCEWSVPLGFPGFRDALELSFVSDARVLPNGDLI